MSSVETTVKKVQIIEGEEMNIQEENRNEAADPEMGPAEREGEQEEEEEPKKHFLIRNAGRIAVALIVITCAVLVIVDYACCGNIKEVLNDFEDFVRDNAVLGCVLIAMVYLGCTVLLIPGAPLTLAAGAILGKAWGPLVGILVGSLVVFVGAFGGATLAFFMGRYSCRPCVTKLADKYKYVRVLDRVFSSQESSLKLLIVLRLSPIIPFAFSNYVYGMLPVSLSHYLISLCFILPGTITYVALGALITSFDSAQAGRIGLYVGIPLLVIALFFLIRAARKELNKMLAEDEANQRATEEGQDIEQETADSEGSGSQEKNGEGEGEKEEGEEAEKMEKMEKGEAESIEKEGAVQPNA